MSSCPNCGAPCDDAGMCMIAGSPVGLISPCEYAAGLREKLNRAREAGDASFERAERAERERDALVDLIEDIHWQLNAPVLSQSGAEAWLQDALKVLWRHGRLEVEAGDE